MDDGGSWNRAFLSEEAQCGGPLGRAPLLGTLEEIRLPRLLTEKDSISGFLSWIQSTLRF